MNRIPLPSPRRVPEGILKILLVASVAELVLWRMSALGPPPVPGAIQGVYAAFRSTGPLALEFAHVISALAALMVAAVTFSGSNWRGRTTAVLLVALVQLSFLFSFVGTGADLWLAYQLTFLAVVALLAWGVSRRGGIRFKLLAAGIVGAYGSSFYFKAAPSLYALTNRPAFGSEVFGVGETLVVFNALMLPWCFARSVRSWRDLFPRGVVALVPAAIFVAVYMVSPWIVSAVSISVLGFSLFLPALVYGVTLWAYTFVLTESRGLGGYSAYALLMLFLAGLMLQHPYLNLLAALALALIAFDRMNQEPVERIADQVIEAGHVSYIAETF